MIAPGWKENLNSLLNLIRDKPASELLGLDIGPDFIKILKINSTKDSFQIENLSIMPTPTNAIVKDEIKNPAGLSDILKEMLEESGVSTRSVAFAIPRSLAIFKNTTVDSRLNDDEIEKKAWIEANRNFPDLIGDIFLDFSIVGPSQQDPSRLELSLVACRKSQVQPYLDVIKQAGLTVNLVDIDCNALERTLPLMISAETAARTTAILNLNTNLSSLVIISQNNLIHAHNQTYDGRRLLSITSDFFKNKQITTDEQISGLANDPEYNNLFKESLMAHLRHTMHFFFSSRPNVSINNILLAGDCAAIPHLAQFIQHEVNIETMIANPFLNMSIAPEVNISTLNKYTPALVLCCGLALSKPY